MHTCFSHDILIHTIIVQFTMTSFSNNGGERHGIKGVSDEIAGYSYLDIAILISACHYLATTSVVNCYIKGRAM